MAHRTLVVGAGPAGLAVARRLGEVGLEYDHVEQHSGVGGLWDIDNPHTPMYESAHFISSKTLSGVPGFPMPAEYPDYPGRVQLLAYLREVSDRLGLTERIRFDTSVTSVRPAQSGPRWEVTFGDGEVDGYDAVVAATGMLHTPIVPELPGTFDGEVMHTRDYRDPSLFRGRRVLVVGGGNSGCDIVCDAIGVAERAVISMRRGYWIIPKHIFGVPADVFGETGPRLPMRLQQKVFRRMLRLLVGDLTRLGLQRPDHEIFETHPLLNSMLVHALQHGDVTARPGLVSISGRTVTFTDGTTEEIDLLVWATGFTHAIPVFDGLVGGTHMPDLWLQTFSREHPGLMAAGFLETNSGAWGHFDRQARMIAGALLDDRDRPGQAAAFRARIANDRPDLTAGLKLVASPRHEGYADAHAFAKAAEATITAYGWPRA